MSCACDNGFRVRGGPGAARDARAALTAELADRLPDPRLRDVHLIVSEIVNNSVLHGRVGDEGWIAIECSLADSRLRVEIRDSGLQGEPIPRDPDYERGGGFGLFIVGALSSRWGVEHEPALTVWFELGVDGAR